MLLPVLKNFQVIPGETFDYRFQYNQGLPNSSTPINLTSMYAQLVIISPQGAAYLTLNSGAYGGTSGLFFGAPGNTPSNGVIDIIIIPVDSAAQTWKYAGYNMYISTSAISGTILPGEALPSGAYQVMYGTFSMIGYSTE
jgi:hypothetical protein